MPAVQETTTILAPLVLTSTSRMMLSLPRKTIPPIRQYHSGYRNDDDDRNFNTPSDHRNRTDIRSPFCPYNPMYKQMEHCDPCRKTDPANLLDEENIYHPKCTIL